MYLPINNIYCFIWNTTELLGEYLKLPVHLITPKGFAPWLFGKCMGIKGERIR